MELLDESFFGTLRRETKIAKQEQIVAWDSEDDAKGNPICFTFYDGENTVYIKDPDAALAYILNYPKPAIFCAHNLEYDIGNLFKKSGFKLVDRLIYASRLLRVTLKFSKHSFLNSAAFFPGSVENMGKVVGLPKLKGDPLSREYAERDAVIVFLYMSRLQKKLFNDYGAGMGVSIGQVSMDVYRRMFMPMEDQVTWNNPMALQAYYGGRVEMFYKGIIKQPITVADFNSCYPFVMRHRAYPDTGMLEKSSITRDTFGIGRFTVLVPDTCFVGPLPYRSPETGRLFFPTGLLTGWWTFHEVRAAIAAGCKMVREWEAIGTSAEVHPFIPYVDHFYNHRQKVKELLEIDPTNTEHIFASTHDKNLMNNLYGKLAQHKPSNVMSRTPLSAAILKQYPDVKVSRVEPFYCYTLTRKQAPKSANYLWGIYVTAYGRMHLYDHLMKVYNSPGTTLIYCDTDSIMYTGDCKDINFGTKLGEMGKESFDLAIFRSSKGYLLCNQNKDGTYEVDKVACKGVPNGHAFNFVLKGIADVVKPMRLKEALIRLQSDDTGDKRNVTRVIKKKSGKGVERDVGINVWDTVRKEMRSIYIKRRGNRGVTQNLNVDAIKAVEENSFAEPEDMTPELVVAGFNLADKPRKASGFENVVIPPGWFDEEKRKKLKPQDLESGMPYILRASDCADLLPGEVWVAGTIVDVIRSKYGKQYKVEILEFLDSEVVADSAIGYLNPKFLHQDDCTHEFVGYKVEISLEKKYIVDRPLQLRVYLENASLLPRVSQQ